MRKNVLVDFIDQTKSVYDPFSGTYADDKETVTELYCNVTDGSSATYSNNSSIKQFDDYKEKTKVIRTTTPIKFPFQFVEINGKRYAVRSINESLGRTSVIAVEMREE